jgi:hypothetical protein
LFRNSRDTQNAIDRLQAAMNVVLQTIRQFAPPEHTAGPIAIRAEDADRLVQRLNELLVAWNSSSTRDIRTAMAGLESLVPQDQLAPLHQALDGYDFSAGTDGTLELMTYIQDLKGDS